MRLERADASLKKGWYLGPWNSNLDISLGYAGQGIDEPHAHRRATEVYLVVRGTSTIRVGHESRTLNEGDVVVVEAGEAHTFVWSSADYFHFVIQIPGLEGEEARDDKVAVPRAMLGLAE